MERAADSSSVAGWGQRFYKWEEELYAFSIHSFEGSINRDLFLVQRVSLLAIAVLSSIVTFPLHFLGNLLISRRIIQVAQEPAQPQRPPPIRQPLRPPALARIPHEALAIDSLEGLCVFYERKINQLQIPAPWQRIQIAGGELKELKAVFREDFQRMVTSLQQAPLENARSTLNTFHASMVHISRAQNENYPRPFHPGRVGFANKQGLDDCGWLCRTVACAHSSLIDYVLLRSIEEPPGGMHHHNVEQDPVGSRKALSEAQQEAGREHYHQKYDTSNQISHEDLLALQQRLRSVVKTLQTGCFQTQADEAHWRYYSNCFLCKHADGHEHTIPQRRHNSGYHFVTDLLTLFRFTWDENGVPFAVEHWDDGDLLNLNIEPDPRAPHQIISPHFLSYVQARFADVRIHAVRKKVYERKASELGIQLFQEAKDAGLLVLTVQQQMIIEASLRIQLQVPARGQLQAQVIGENLCVISTEDEKYQLSISGEELLRRMFHTDWRVARILQQGKDRYDRDYGHYRLMLRGQDGTITSIDDGFFSPSVAAYAGQRPEGQYTDPNAFLQDYLTQVRAPDQQRAFRDVRQITFGV